MKSVQKEDFYKQKEKRPCTLNLGFSVASLYIQYFELTLASLLFHLVRKEETKLLVRVQQL